MNNYGYIKSLYQAAKNSGNPMQFFQMMANNNPNLQPIVNILNQGQNPKDIFYEMCKQKGINPDEVLKSLNS